MEKKGDRFVCSLCNLYADLRPAGIASHICASHKFGPVISFPCGLCDRLYTTDHCDAYRAHVYSRHRLGDDSGLAAPLDDDILVLRDEDNIASDDVACEPASPSHSTAGTSSFKIAVAEFVIRTLEERKVTQTAMNGIIKDLEGIWEMALD